MSHIVIKVESIGKLYKLGEIGTGTISHDLNRWWARLRGKEDPFSKIGETNHRKAKGNSDWVWALKDINFEVKQGEVLGLIGRNGAGKSTLLKLLSKVTKPTTGRIKAKGRIASLLEVGTGFHPELTGRENIFLNGAILGMSKAEIKGKFDEIVDFSGVERYIDTPVKRYSSGMYVRLAFAVAAFLEPEILIIDEVLAVGDIEFQKKCILRMESIARDNGRTIIFVSHDLKAVGSLCMKSIVLNEGRIVYSGSTPAAIKQYITDNRHSATGIIREDKKVITFLGIANETALTSLWIDQDIVVELRFSSADYSTRTLYFDIGIHNERGDMIIHSKTKYVSKPFEIARNANFILTYRIEKPNLAPGSYLMTLFVYDEHMNKEILFWMEGIPAFHISSGNPYASLDETDFLEEIKSIIYPQSGFSIKYE